MPVILFTKGGGQWLEAMANTGCHAWDWTGLQTSVRARRQVGDRVALQGNMDPAVLYSSPARIREEVGRILDSFGSGSGHIFNLGHGIPLRWTPSAPARLLTQFTNCLRSTTKYSVKGFHLSLKMTGYLRCLVLIAVRLTLNYV